MLGHENLMKFIFVHYNMRLHLKYVGENGFTVESRKPIDIDLTEMFQDIDDDEEPIYSWVKEFGEPLLDTPQGDPDPCIVRMIREVEGMQGVNIGSEPVLPTRDDEMMHSIYEDDQVSDDGGNVDNEIGSSSDDDGSNGDVDLYGGNGGGQATTDTGDTMEPLTFTCEESQYRNNFETQNVDHGSRSKIARNHAYLPMVNENEIHQAYSHGFVDIEVDSLSSTFDGMSLSGSTGYGSSSANSQSQWGRTVNFQQQRGYDSSSTEDVTVNGVG